MQALQDFPQLTALKEMQSFLGLANYYRKFIKEFSGIAVPLMNTLQKASQTRPIIWDSIILEVFQQLKDTLISASCLRLPDLNGGSNIWRSSRMSKTDHFLGRLLHGISQPLTKILVNG